MENNKINKKIDALCFIIFIIYIVCMLFCFNEKEVVKLIPNKEERVASFIFGVPIFYILSKILAKFLKSIYILFE